MNSIQYKFRNMEQDPDVVDYIRTNTESLFGLMPSDSTVTVEAAKMDLGYFVCIKVNSVEMEFKDARMTPNPYYAFDQVSDRAKDEIYSWWNHRFGYVATDYRYI